MLANTDLVLGHTAEARTVARGLAAGTLDSVEPNNDWPVRLALLEAETAYAETPGDLHRRQLGAALAAIAASHDDDHQYLRDQGAALLARVGAAGGR